jgi:hypothetical protein
MSVLEPCERLCLQRPPQRVEGDRVHAKAMQERASGEGDLKSAADEQS